MELITESYLRKWKTNSFVQALLWALMGLVMIILHNALKYSTCYVLGTILLIQGIPQLFLFVMEDEKHIFSTIFLLTGILIAFLGIWALTRPDEVQPQIPNVIAFVTLLHGLKDIPLSKHVYALQPKSGILAYFITCSTIIVSSLILFLPVVNTETMAIISGILLIIDGISDFWMWSVVVKRSDELRGI